MNREEIEFAVPWVLFAISLFFAGYYSRRNHFAQQWIGLMDGDIQRKRELIDKRDKDLAAALMVAKDTEDELYKKSLRLASVTKAKNAQENSYKEALSHITEMERKDEHQKEVIRKLQDTVDSQKYVMGLDERFLKVTQDKIEAVEALPEVLANLVERMSRDHEQLWGSMDALEMTLKEVREVREKLAPLVNESMDLVKPEEDLVIHDCLPGDPEPTLEIEKDDLGGCLVARTAVVPYLEGGKAAKPVTEL